MYEKCTAGQQNGLVYGSRLRCIGAVQGLLGSYTRSTNDEINPFTPAELEIIEGICQDAKSRAKASFEETKFRLEDAKASRRPEAEPRQYNGK